MDATSPESHKCFVARVDAQGRVVIPAELRRLLNIERGSRLVFRLEDGHIVLRTIHQVGEFLHSRYGDPHRSMADELVAERRAETAAEAWGLPEDWTDWAPPKS